MSVASNFDDVLGQLQAFGLLVTASELVIGKRMRCRAKDGGREKRGWYQLYEVPSNDSSTMLIVGSFGSFWAAENLVQKVAIKRGEQQKLSAEQLAVIKARITEDKKAADREAGLKAQRASHEASKAWAVCIEDGDCDYLHRKQVKGHGVRFSPKGNMLIPMLDATGKISGLQVIYGSPETKAKKGRDKDFWPAGLAKKGRWFQIGGIPQGLMLLCEGYATGASLFEATGLPVAVAFDAGNLLPVAEALLKKYRRLRILICADDDYLGTCKECGEYTLVAEQNCSHCGKPHGKSNAGVAAARNTALAVEGIAITPTFATERAVDAKGPTDFNDLHVQEGLHVVTQQIEAHLTALKWTTKAAPAVSAAATGGEGAKPDLKSLLQVDEACGRYSLIYGAGGSMFDHQEHMLVPKSDVMDVLVDHGWREWKLRPDRSVVRLTEVGFDPACKDARIKCNLWGGWPTKAKAGRCEVLLDVLRYLCSEEDKPEEIFNWVVCWLAYPIQNPGAKMKTALIMHGPQGAGKNLFFEAIMAIYGEYGSIVDQSAVEDKFNDWASKKLFMIADEVVARQELYHVKNKLKGFVTGDKIRINPKNVAAHDEVNHVNLVFLSNECQPLVLDRDDRRYTVIWTPQKLDRDFYAEAHEELDAGGVAALHDYLLNYDLGDFKPHTNPPNTKSKRDLIDLGLDSTERFWLQWVDGYLDGVPVVPCRSEEFYDLYKTWCSRVGIPRPAPQHILLGNIGKRADCTKGVQWYYQGATKKQSTFIWPSKAELPPGTKPIAWLGECNDLFVEAVKSWKGSQ